MLIMSGRIEKRKSRAIKTEQRLSLFVAMSSSAAERSPGCSACTRRKTACRVSELDSTRCQECVGRGLAKCDVFGLSASDMQALVHQDSKLEAEIEEIEEERRALDEKIQRLRKQRKMWREKLARAIERGLKSVEELDREEEEERRRATEIAPGSSDPPTSSDDFMNEWDGTFPEVDLDPSVLAQFGLVDGRIPALPSGSSGGQ